MPVLFLGYFCARERPSGPLRGLRDCLRVRLTSTKRRVGLMAPDERPAAKDAGRRLQLRPATWQKRVSVDNTVSRTVLHILGNPGRLLQSGMRLQSCVLHDDDFAWRSSLDAYRPLSIQGSCANFTEYRRYSQVPALPL